MRKFLPEGGPYNVSQPEGNSFVEDDAGLLTRIGNNVAVRAASTEGRVPSPVSRAYMFYTSLFQRSVAESGMQDDKDKKLADSEGRKAMMRKARAAFRGVLATFALRDPLDISLEYDTIQLNPDGDALSRVLVPALQSAPGGEEFWNPIKLYKVVGEGYSEVIAGRSPLTGIFPGARVLKGLKSLYWYEEQTGTWYDPTGQLLDEKDRLRVSAETSRKVNGLIKAWLEKVLDSTKLTQLEQRPFLMDRRDAGDLLEELEAWYDDLRLEPVPSGVEIARAPVASDEMGQEELPFLRWKVGATPEAIITDVSLHSGRLVVTGNDLRSKNKRLYGREFGDRKYGEQLIDIPAFGENLGQALGLGGEVIPVPFVFVDKLFTPRLTTISLDGFSREWKGLVVDNQGKNEYNLYPFQPEILELMSPEELERSVSGSLSQDGQKYIVKLQLDSKEPIIKNYDAIGDHGDYVLDDIVAPDTVDVRFFPNYDISSVRHLFPQDGTSANRYYARIRQAPNWNFSVQAFRLREDDVIQRGVGQRSVIGSTDEVAGSGYSLGEAHFLEFNSKPTGFYFPDRGFSLLDLKDPRVQGQNHVDWTVGVDFGTTNTCVAYRAGTDAPKVLELPVLTTTLLESPNYQANFGNVFEGASAALDFFYKYGGQDEELMSRDFFPTQFVTQQQNVEVDDQFHLQNGLIYFDNFGVAKPALLELIKGYPAEKDLPKRFEVRRDIKWSRTNWLRVFMHHLRKQVVYTAAYNNAKVVEARFSYPKSFTFSKQQRFEGDIDTVWQSFDTPMASESEAVRDFQVSTNNEHVIFDIGGGTADIIAFSEKEPVYQTSFRLAAGQINQYVVASPEFRQKFLDAIQDASSEPLSQVFPALQEQFRAKGNDETDEEAIETVWLGLLQRIEDVDPSGKLLVKILNYLRDEAEQGDAVHGFFLSITLIFTGLSYYAGQLLRLASGGTFEGQVFTLNKVTMALTGNGSRLYHMLDHSQAPFSEVMKSLFKKGLEPRSGNQVPVIFQGPHKYNGRTAPKVSVALGLLSDAAVAQGLPSVPVANVVGESGYGENGDEVAFDEASLPFYQRANHRAFKVPTSPPPNLKRFLKSLDAVLPYGMNDQFEVVPRAESDWCDRLQTELYDQARPFINDRIKDNAREYDGLEKKKEQPALEPLFIVELGSLLDAVRESHAS